MGKMELIEVESRKLELEVQKFELEQRRAKALSVSAFFPDQLKNDVASAVQIYDLAQRMNISVLEVAQSVYIIYGRPSFATTFLVARLNQSGLIKGALKTVISEDRQRAYCKAIDAATGDELVGMEVTMEMAKKEGWISKKGSKWQTMPELMLRKRAQSFFIKEYFPEVMFGMQTVEEVEDTETIPTEAIPTKHDDLNAALSQQKKPATAEARSKPQEAAPKPTEKQDEEEAQTSKQRRVPRYVSKWYFELQKLGVKKHDLRKFVDYMDWMDLEEGMIADFFTQDENEKMRYVNAFYGIGGTEDDVQDAEYEEIDDEAEAVFGNGEVSPNEALVSQDTTQTRSTRETNTQPPRAGVSLARYHGKLIAHGLKPEDCEEFMEWAQIDSTNANDFFADEGAVQALIEQFNEEAGYAG